jgi:hypothetical protein
MALAFDPTCQENIDLVGRDQKARHSAGAAAFGGALHVGNTFWEN